MTFKFEAMQVFMRLWQAYIQRLRSIVKTQNKIAVCQFFGVFAPAGLLNSESREAGTNTQNSMKMSYSPSFELTKQKRLTFQEKLPTSMSIATYQGILAKYPEDRQSLVYINYANLGTQVDLNESQVRTIFSNILDTIVRL